MSDIEQTVKEWLDADPRLADWPVLRTVPPNRPTRFITVERTGGGEGLHSSTPLVTIQVWAENRAESAYTAGLVSVRMIDMPLGISEIADTTVESVVNLPFPGPPPQARTQVLAQITQAAQ
ncbi:hypothetical protein JS533_007400 [Bifidobacterium amazonense]|uniref:Transcriptional regulator n=1 Tax=Bifidobacterium amazonense TaxID=2809027 RepID=A0ABS9VVH7_9BIFI|nr:hypothetical protein [Bifidobacterium amazonense]MCH9276098.1 hypothetical protein [Bifidobacterium amazonense]